MGNQGVMMIGVAATIAMTSLLLAFLAGRYSRDFWRNRMPQTRSPPSSRRQAPNLHGNHHHHPGKDDHVATLAGSGDEMRGEGSAFFSLIGDTPLVKIASLSRDTGCHIYV